MEADKPNRPLVRRGLPILGALLALLLTPLIWWRYGPGHQERLNTALLLSAAEGDTDGVRFYLKLGANPNARAKDDRPALMIAAEAPIISMGPIMRMIGGHAVCRQESLPRGYPEIVHALLQAGADSRVHDKKGITPLQQASQLSAWDAIEELKRAEEVK